MSDNLAGPEHLRGLRELFERAPVTGFLGQRLRACGEGAAEVHLPFREEFVQGKGVIHGGIITLIADTAGYFAAASLGDELVATAQIDMSLLAPARKTDLTASAVVLGSGKRLIVCRLEVVSAADTLVAAGQATYAVLRRDAAPLREAEAAP